MTGDKIPDLHHISRLCKPKHVQEGQIQATAFMLKSDEEYLSVNWLECLDYSSRTIEINEIRRVLSIKLKIGARAKIAVLNVGEVCEKVLTETQDRRKIEVLHAPEDDDLSHSGIYNLRHDDELIAGLILETVQETHSARL